MAKQCNANSSNVEVWRCGVKDHVEGKPSRKVGIVYLVENELLVPMTIPLFLKAHRGFRRLGFSGFAAIGDCAARIKSFP